jgi:hypothetical protein
MYALSIRRCALISMKKVRFFYCHGEKAKLIMQVVQVNASMNGVEVKGHVCGISHPVKER